MGSLLDFFNSITGLSLSIDNPVVLVVCMLFGFILIYNMVYIIFGSFSGLFK